VVPRIWADFNKTGGGRLELTLPQTLNGLRQQGIELRDELRMTFWDYDADDEGSPMQLEVEATVYFDGARECWAARYDPEAVRSVKPAR
jgi:hypothetical protein